jgi:hypothetical protein
MVNDVIGFIITVIGLVYSIFGIIAYKRLGKKSGWPGAAFMYGLCSLSDNSNYYKKG